MKMIAKINCKNKCGRKTMVVRPEYGLPERIECGHCKTYGVEKSKQLQKEFMEQFK